MPKIQIETNVTGNIEAHVTYELDQPITLTASGSGFGSTDLIDVEDGILNIEFIGHGVTGTSWTLEVNELKPTPRPLFKHSGTIGNSGNTLLTDAVFV